MKIPLNRKYSPEERILYICKNLKDSTSTTLCQIDIFSDNNERILAIKKGEFLGLFNSKEELHTKIILFIYIQGKIDF